MPRIYKKDVEKGLITFLEDGAIFQVHESHTAKIEKWIVGDVVDVAISENPTAPYTLTNPHSLDWVWASKIAASAMNGG